MKAPSGPVAGFSDHTQGVGSPADGARPTLRHQKCNARGWPCGDTHYNAKYTDEQVADAVRRIEAGEIAAHIARELGAPRSYVSAWARGARRKPPARIVVRTGVRSADRRRRDAGSVDVPGSAAAYEPMAKSAAETTGGTTP